jgi:hypothetical protein
VTSAIAIHPNAVLSFRAIAEAGGGVFVKLFREGRGGQLHPDEGGPRTLVTHVMSMSFGEQWRTEAEAFVETWFVYHDAGFFD